MKTSAQLQAEGLRKLRDPTLKYIIGVDEVGYGAWAGPVVVCAAIAAVGWSHPEVTDSKDVKEPVRERLVKEILKPPVIRAYSIMEHSNVAVDSMGLAKARDALVLAAVKYCLQKEPTAMVVMDGNQLPRGLPSRSLCFPKADALVPAVSAASILAKVYRDNLMRKLHEEYPWYDFGSNVGYGTGMHEQGIEEHGLCAVHRRSYRNIKQHAAKEVRMKRALARLLTWRPLPNATHD
jgi:ribonuclease HII